MCASSPAHGSAIAVLERSWAWLNAYFAGQTPRWVPPMDFGGDDFEHAVCVALLGVPYGEAVTVDDVAASVAYFAGQTPRWVPPMDFGGDDFEHAVCVALLGVPYGEAVTVDDVAASVAYRIGGAPDVCAVRDAALRCPVRVIVPMHRVEGLLTPDDPRECVSVALRALEAAR